VLPPGVEEQGRLFIERRLPLQVRLHGGATPILDLPSLFRSHLLWRRLYHHIIRCLFSAVAGHLPRRKLRERKVDLFIGQSADNRGK
jgi:hypothetical protein